MWPAVIAIVVVALIGYGLMWLVAWQGKDS